MSLEDNFKQMELLIKRLEQENISLEEAFSAYSRGMEVLKNCNEQLDMVEKKVLKLSATGQLEEF
ncbi:MAG: exodeoxyribonuclease VII small subunit [Lachnospiraceae bacterium]|nr:exodeoxyribonuclease VII small subunit [Lachnospiraceae bacterium]